jgi:inner membrane protein
VCLGKVLGAHVQARLEGEGHRVGQLVALPDVMSPVFWRVVYEDRPAPGDGAAGAEGADGASDASWTKVVTQGMDGVGRLRTEPEAFRTAPAAMVDALSAQSAGCRAFLDFMLMPIVRPLPEEDRPKDWDGQRRYFLLGDLRYGSSLAWVRRAMSLRSHGAEPFQLMVEVAGGDGWRLTRERMRFSGSGQDTGWQDVGTSASAGGDARRSR